MQGGLESTTEQEISTLSESAAELLAMLDALLVEHSSLLDFMAKLDAENIVEACKGWGTNNTRLIEVITARSKAHLTRVGLAYSEQYEEAKDTLVEHMYKDIGSSWWPPPQPPPPPPPPCSQPTVSGPAPPPLDEAG